MADAACFAADVPATTVPDWRAEVARLNGIIRALMDRAERSTSVQNSGFSLLQTAVTLETQVRKRTAQLEAALHENDKINRALRESESKFRGLVGQSLVGIVIVERGRFTYSNSKFNDIFGYREEEILALRPLELALAEDRPVVEEHICNLAGSEKTQCSFRGLRKDGTIINVEAHSSTMKIAGEAALICVFMDITERVRAEQAIQALQATLREQSVRDSLTGLYNRRYLDDTLQRELAAADRAATPVSVVLVDIDHFKTVNDRYGHPAGDEVLRSFSALMQGYVRGGDMLCRYGGEEFLLVLTSAPIAAAAERAEELRVAIAAAPIAYGEFLIPITASFGIASFPRDGRDAATLIAAADGALYTAKAAGRNCVRSSAPPADVTPA